MEPSVTSDRHADQVDGGPPTVVDVIRRGIIDPELAGLLWTLVDGGLPVIVAGTGTAGPSGRQPRGDLADALLDLIPGTRAALPLQGATEDFRWLPDAERLGWVRSTPAEEPSADPRATFLIGGELGAGPPADLTGDRVRLVVRAVGLGYGLLATIEAGGLDEVLATLRHRPIFLTDDELSNLGVVLVLGSSGDRSSGDAAVSSGGARVVAAHYIRPLARDVHGHTQRLLPAVLATWDEPMGRFEHFAWGVAGELAERIGRRSGDLEAESERRAAVIAALAAGAVAPLDRAALRAQLEHQRALGATSATSHRH